MSEIIASNNAHTKPGRTKRRNQHSTRIDLTPMVDLGFLLITFFIFTTTISKKNSTNLYMPKDSNDSTLIKNTGALTILLFDKNRVFYYEGNNPLMMKTTNYSSLRTIILKKKNTTKARDFFVIIKPGKDATYKNTIDVLDEMSINDVSRYAISDPGSDETNRIQQLQQQESLPNAL